MQEKISIAYLVRPAEGGIKSHLLTLLAGLDKSRFVPTVICPGDTSLFQEVQKAGYAAISLDLAGDLSPVKDLSAIIRLRSILSELRPDILHIHSAKAGLVGRFAAVTLFRRPKIVLTMHSFVFDERTGPKKRALVSFLERRLLPIADAIVSVSCALKDQLVSQMGLNPQKIQVIYNGIPPCLPAPMRKRGDAQTVGTVSRLAPQKGMDHFIRAASIVRASHPSAKFVVVGDGPLRQQLEKLSEELGLSGAIEFLGFRPDASEILSTFDVFVLASTFETFGITLVEALSKNVPVVASRVGGIPEIIDGKTTGLFAEPGDAEEIAERVSQILDDRELAERLGRDGGEFVREHFTSARMVDATCALYLGLMRK